MGSRVDGGFAVCTGACVAGDFAAGTWTFAIAAGSADFTGGPFFCDCGGDAGFCCCAGLGGAAGFGRFSVRGGMGMLLTDFNFASVTGFFAGVNFGCGVNPGGAM